MLGDFNVIRDKSLGRYRKNERETNHFKREVGEPREIFQLVEKNRSTGN